MSAALKAAIDYARRRGWPVFPCNSMKRPLTPRGFHDATTDEAQLQWWCWDAALVAVATGRHSGLVVLDIDIRESGSGLDTLQMLGVNFHPQTATAHTPSGGIHCFFAWPGYEVPNSASKIGPYLDVRGDGGYVIAPPSVHPNGRPYCWNVDTTRDFAAAPDWLTTIIRTAKCGNGKIGKPLEHWHSVLTEPIANGQRNATLASIAGKLVHCGLRDAVLLYDLVECVNLARCEQPLPPTEVETIVISVMRSHFRRPQT